MTDTDDFEPSELPDDLLALLGDETVWAEVDPQLEQSIVDAIAAEADVGPTQPSGSDRAVTPIGEARTVRWRSAALGAAAALLLVFGVAGIVRLASSSDSDFEVALAGTELAIGASATADVDLTPQGTRIVLDVEGLAPAPPGSYYEAWLRKDAEQGVSAGTFHLRGGDAEIELWSGVSPADFPLLTVTIQQEGQSESSGQVVLRGMIEIDG